MISKVLILSRSCPRIRFPKKEASFLVGSKPLTYLSLSVFWLLFFFLLVHGKLIPVILSKFSWVLVARRSKQGYPPFRFLMTPRVLSYRDKRTTGTRGCRWVIGQPGILEAWSYLPSWDLGEWIWHRDYSNKQEALTLANPWLSDHPPTPPSSPVLSSIYEYRTSSFLLAYRSIRPENPKSSVMCLERAREHVMKGRGEGRFHKIQRMIP